MSDELETGLRTGLGHALMFCDPTLSDVVMVSPRLDLWVVSADKPADRAGFDLVVRLPFEQSVRHISDKGVSRMVYELFDSAEQAHEFAAEIKFHGATNIKVSEPRIPRQGHSASSQQVEREELQLRISDFLKRPKAEDGGK